ncbi:hypothetical protein OIV83_003782 [Microbotryomycetes sp. JL201]|nr:hypothetical protein OIV83_003782 [Microbotryomycetes sp. JL201]
MEEQVALTASTRRSALPPPPVPQQLELDGQVITSQSRDRKPLPTPPGVTNLVGIRQDAPSPPSLLSQPVSAEKRAYAQAIGIDIPSKAHGAEIGSPDSILPSYQDRDPDEREGLAKSDRSSPETGPVTDEDLKMSCELDQVRDLLENETKAQLRLDAVAQKARHSDGSYELSQHRGRQWAPLDNPACHLEQTLREQSGDPEFMPAGGVCLSLGELDEQTKYRHQGTIADSKRGSQGAKQERTASLYNHSVSRASVTQTPPYLKQSDFPAEDLGNLPWLRVAEFGDRSPRDISGDPSTSQLSRISLGGLARLEQSTNPATLAKLKRSMSRARGFYGAGIGSAAYGSELEVVFESSTAKRKPPA